MAIIITSGICCFNVDTEEVVDNNFDLKLELELELKLKLELVSGFDFSIDDMFIV